MAKFNFIYNLRWCASLSKPYRGYLFLFYIVELFIIASSLLFVVFSKKAIDYAIARDEPQMLSAIYWAVGLMLSSLILKVVSTKCNEISKMRMLADLQNEVSRTQMYANWAYIKNWNTGDIQFRIQRDCVEVVQMIAQTLPNFTLTIIRLVASLSLLWVMDSRLALIIIAITPLFAFSKIYFQKFRKLNKELKNEEGNLSHVINENLKFRILIKTLGVERNRLKKIFETQNKVLNLKSTILNFSLISQTVLKATVTFGFLLTFVWGVLGLSTGQISFGTMSAFLQLVGRVQNPMLGVLGFFPSFIAFDVAAERVKEIVNSKLETNEEQVAVHNVDKIELTNIGFKYHNSVVLENVNLILKKGESTAILGASGRGKTTLIRILLSVLTPQKGDVKLYYNNGEVNDMGPIFRTNISYVPQGDKLFFGSIRDNLLLGATHVSDERIQKALYYSCAEFINELPEGLDTLVGESTNGLSEGQAQRVAIARALLRDTSIWLFDEITSALDSSTSLELMKRLQEISKDRIFVFVTHDTKLAAYCDHIYNIN